MVEKWTPEQVQEYDARIEANIQESLKFLDELAETNGYSAVSSVEELGLTKEQLKQIHYGAKSTPYRRFYKATRDDGKEIVLIITPSGGGDTFSADIFSPAFHEGHGMNHDFNRGELEGNLDLAMKGRPL